MDAVAETEDNFQNTCCISVRSHWALALTLAMQIFTIERLVLHRSPFLGILRDS